MATRRRDPKLQAELMTEAWGVETARRHVELAHMRDISSKEKSEYWLRVLNCFPKPPAPPPKATPQGVAEQWLTEHNIKYRIAFVRDDAPRAMHKPVIQIDPNQERFFMMAASFNSRTSGSQPEDGGA